MTLPLADQTAACLLRDSCNPNSVIAANFNGDGNVDIAVLNQSAGTVSIFLGNGDGTFQTGVAYPAGVGSASYAGSMDVNSDGIADLIVANPNSSAVSILLGNGDGSLQAPAQYVTGAGGYSFAVNTIRITSSRPESSMLGKPRFEAPDSKAMSETR